MIKKIIWKYINFMYKKITSVILPLKRVKILSFTELIILARGYRLQLSYPYHVFLRI